MWDVILVFCPTWPSTLFLQLKRNVSTDCSIYAFYMSHCIFTETIKCTKWKKSVVTCCFNWHNNALILSKMTLITLMGSSFFVWSNLKFDDPKYIIAQPGLALCTPP